MITRKYVDNQVNVINSKLGFDNADYSTIGSISFRGENGGYLLGKIMNEHGGLRSLYRGTLRECSCFISGMIEMTHE